MAHIIQFSEAAFIALHGMVIVAKSEKKELVNVLQIAVQSEQFKASCCQSNAAARKRWLPQFSSRSNRRLYHEKAC